VLPRSGQVFGPQLDKVDGEVLINAVCQQLAVGGYLVSARKTLVLVSLNWSPALRGSADSAEPPLAEPGQERAGLRRFTPYEGRKAPNYRCCPGGYEMRCSLTSTSAPRGMGLSQSDGRRLPVRQLRYSEDFLRMITCASIVVANIGVITTLRCLPDS
jgi:hypothetical protein